ADLDGVALADRLVHERDLGGFVAWRDHAAAVVILQRSDAAGVIAVVMRHQDVAELPAGLVQCRLDRPRLRGIDRGGRPARRVGDEDTVIVLQAEEQVRLCGHGAIPSGLVDVGRGLCGHGLRAVLSLYCYPAAPDSPAAGRASGCSNCRRAMSLDVVDLR